LSDKEILVIANGCTDGTPKYISELIKSNDSIKILNYPDPLGYTESTNLGIEFTSGKYVVFLNNDTVLLDQPTDLWINLLLEPLKDKNIAVTGPLMLRDRLTDYPFILFFCAATRRSIIQEIGTLDENFSPGGCEDIDFCIRAQKKGYKCIAVPGDHNITGENKFFSGGFPIYHMGEGTFKHETGYSEHFSRNEQKILEKHGHR